MNLSNEQIITLFQNHSDNFRFNIKEQSLLIELLQVEIESYKKDNLNKKKPRKKLINLG